MQYRFIDRVREIDAEGAGTLTLVKTFARSEDFFNGSFREPNEVPSSLVLETMASAGSFLLTVRSRYRALALLIKVNHAAFSRSVLAGDRVTVRSQLLGIQGSWGENEGPVQAGSLAQAFIRCFVDDTPVAEADLLFLCAPIVRTAGPSMERTVSGYLDLLGLADARP
jgi:3-hydroxymyristoyl/3-hydroxydecanoyl-(acyl carrier protein) dehydratase